MVFFHSVAETLFYSNVLSSKRVGEEQGCRLVMSVLLFVQKKDVETKKIPSMEKDWPRRKFFIL